MLVSTQSATEVKEVADQVLALADEPRPGQAAADASRSTPREGATFPYAWYFRHLPTGYIDLQQENAAPPTTDVVVMTDDGQGKPPAERARRLRRPPVPRSASGGCATTARSAPATCSRYITSARSGTRPAG